MRLRCVFSVVLPKVYLLHGCCVLLCFILPLPALCTDTHFIPVLCLLEDIKLGQWPLCLIIQLLNPSLCHCQAFQTTTEVPVLNSRCSDVMRIAA